MFKELSRSTAQVIVPLLVYLIMRFFWFTSKKRFHVAGEISQEQSICVCWHGELLMSTQAYRYIHKKQLASAIISRHFDGEMIARVLKYLSISPLRGSSSHGAKQVLLEAFRTLKKGDDLLVTPDGPRGPRHMMSDGAVALAYKAKVPVLIVNYIPTSYWQLGSWDKFVIPKPFSTIDFYVKNVSLEGMELDEAKAFLREKMLVHTVE